MSDRVEVKKNYRNEEDGKVKVGPRNFYSASGHTRPGKQRTFNFFTDQPEFIPCDYNNASKLAAVERL